MLKPVKVRLSGLQDNFKWCIYNTETEEVLLYIGIYDTEQECEKLINNYYKII